MASITETAQAFFEACEGGKGWQGCAPYCHSDAGFSSQAEPLTDVRTLEAYTEWMKGLLTFVPDGRYTLKAFATDEKVAPAKSFDTLDQAAKYVDEGAEFANVQRMLMSLEIKN